jgi:hypothetical protein
MSAYKITCPGCGGKFEGDSALAGTEVVPRRDAINALERSIALR